MAFKLALVTDHSMSHGGGRERSIIELYRSLRRAEKDVFIIAPPCDFSNRRTLEVPYFSTRRIRETTERLLEQGFIDTAIYSTGNLLSVVSEKPKLRRRQVLFVRDVEEVGRWSAGCVPEGVRLLANSNFVASRVHEKSGQSATVLEPQFNFPNQRAMATGDYVTFINPVRKKGLALACEIAKLLPHRKFLFVEGWKQPDEQLVQLKLLLAELPNVEFGEWRHDVEHYYLRSRVLLVPSIWEEGFGRVVVEANAYGVPVLASEIGGLPEAVGKGGCLISPLAGPEVWAEALERMFVHGSFRTDLQEAAVANAAYHSSRYQTTAERILSFASSGDTRYGIPAQPALPCVDVIMTHYNYSEFVAHSTSSVLNQTYGNFRLTIIDDRSKDVERQNLTRIVHDLNDARISLILGAQNKGQIGAFFDAFRNTRAEFVALIDPDDIYAPDFLKMMLSAHLNPLVSVGIASCDMKTFQYNSGDLTSFFSRTRQGDRLKAPDLDHGYMQDCFGYAKFYPPEERAWVWGTTSSLMCRRSFIENIMPTDDIKYRFDLDSYLSFGCHIQAGSIFVDHRLVARGRHGDNTAFADETFSDLQSRNKASFESGYEDLKAIAMQKILQTQGIDRTRIAELSQNLPPRYREDFIAKFM